LTLAPLDDLLGVRQFGNVGPAERLTELGDDVRVPRTRQEAFADADQSLAQGRAQLRAELVLVERVLETVEPLARPAEQSFAIIPLAARAERHDALGHEPGHRHLHRKLDFLLAIQLTHAGAQELLHVLVALALQLRNRDREVELCPYPIGNRL